MKPPRLLIFAGANGSGKSTLTKIYRRKLEILGAILDPDAEARLLNPKDVHKAAIQAARNTLKRQTEYLESGQSFTLETTLSSKGNLELMQNAKSLGWVVRLAYVGLGDVQRNIQRVKQRVQQGGHDVPLEDIKRRFERSMLNLPFAAEIADVFAVYDNSGLEMRRMLYVKNHRIRRYASSNGKSWWEVALEPYLKSLESRA
jgi:predicted ABC-type ATPase